MSYEDTVSITLAISAVIHVTCAVVVVLQALSIKELRSRYLESAKQRIRAAGEIGHLNEQIQELTNVIGDSVADRYLWHEERQELIAKLFALQRPIDTTKGETD